MPTRKDVKLQQRLVRGRLLPVCSHGECQSTTVWDFKTCWEHLTSAEQQTLKERLSAALRSGDDLTEIILTGAELAGFDFTGANLKGAFLDAANLQGAKLVDTDLHRAFLQNANLVGANLTRAELNGAVFTGAHLQNVDLAAYSISFGRTPINLTMESFGRDGFLRRPHINESEPRFAEPTYRALKANFTAIGDYDSASWASFSERLMQRRLLWREKRFFRWVASWFFGALSGYGERPLRTFLASIFIVLGYAVLYWGRDLLMLANASDHLSKFDAMCFSIATFAGLSLSDVITTPIPSARLAASTEAFAGMFVFGLFIFTLTKRYVAR